ncbi:MAG: hypothetical protein HZA61_07260 [Candidatus Eisenbacteria bacterium]|uniref:Uncharacterized protein n=1 Tax=Eiseniibacteriota bacterium TaxID=2212470 RepID=A0A933W1P7_UNCEI|nr:hypothetical protein [Candidatus Eisenbacteria bacterium]
MRNRILSTLLLLTVGVTIVAAPADAQFDKLRGKRRSSRPPGPVAPAYPTFAATGEWGGVLSGEIVLNGRPYRIAPSAAIYEVGRGPMPVGTSYANRMLFVTGFESSTGSIVTSVIVRPARDVALGGTDGSMFIKVRPIDSPGNPQ